MPAEGGEPFIVPPRVPTPTAGMEYLRCLISKESSKYFAVNVSAMMPVIGGTEGVTISTGMQSAVAMVEKCGDNVFPGMRYGGWYSDLGKEGDAKMGDMLTGRITPEQFVEAVQAMADKVKGRSGGNQVHTPILADGVERGLTARVVRILAACVARVFAAPVT